MTEATILRRYKAAGSEREKKEAINVMTELNACSSEVITRILIDGGVPQEEILSLYRKKKVSKEKVNQIAKGIKQTAIDASAREAIQAADDVDSKEVAQAADVKQTSAIPISVIDACIKRIDEIAVQIMHLQNESKEISEFLFGKLDSKR